MNHWHDTIDDTLVEVQNARAASQIVIVCEHASSHIPKEFDNLGLHGAALKSHVAWDPGARALAAHMAKTLDAVLVAARTSRLVYDCNRPPHAPDAMPSRSEIIDVPGNVALSAEQKAERAERYYEPFRAAVADIIASRDAPILVTVHSFTPVFNGKKRDVEIGVLHDSDARLADAMLSLSGQHVPHVVRRNDPYGPEDGVTHTLKEHALPGGHLNVMLEVRNDLIADEHTQSAMSEIMSNWILQALSLPKVITCTI